MLIDRDEIQRTAAAGFAIWGAIDAGAGFVNALAQRPDVANIDVNFGWAAMAFAKTISPSASGRDKLIGFAGLGLSAAMIVGGQILGHTVSPELSGITSNAWMPTAVATLGTRSNPFRKYRPQ